ncbi:MAG: hypothetical protein P8L79_03300 [Rhodospirillaceae bacterium]|nr:hypothetical protein [Rhodospirillaceae bacterium]
MFRIIVSSCFVLLLITGSVIAQDNLSSDTFPIVKARTLSKDKITVPEDFSAAYNILLISFGRDMQEPVDAWDAALTSLRESSDQVQVYNTPLIPNPGAIVRGFINSGFRSIYKDEALRDRIVILFVKEKEVFPALAIDDDVKAAPLVLVVAQDGTITGRVQGLADAANVAAVLAFVTP